MFGESSTYDHQVIDRTDTMFSNPLEGSLNTFARRHFFIERAPDSAVKCLVTANVTASLYIWKISRHDVSCGEFRPIILIGQCLHATKLYKKNWPMSSHEAHEAHKAD